MTSASSEKSQGSPVPAEVVAASERSSDGPYRLYKRRFVGLVGMVVLNLVGAMGWVWFGPIANNASRDFNITLDQVSWLGNTTALIYLPVSILIPIFISKFSFRRVCEIGTVTLLISGWVRYAGTASTLSGGRAYALLIIGQMFAAITQPIFQVLGPKYSELWFDLRGRTTATMIIAISNPIGGAIGQLLSPLVGDTKQSILVLAIISTAACPFLFLISEAPPTPPTYAATHDSGSMKPLLKAWILGNVPESDPSYMEPRERIDFGLIVVVFGVIAGLTNTFGVLSNQFLEPKGYDADTSGLMGACLLLSGVVAALVTAPLFDRVFTHHLAITSKSIVPIIALAWLSMIWAVRAGVGGAIFGVLAVIGAASLTILPVALELGVELTRNADGSSAILWFCCNLWCVIFILVDGALRKPESENYDMRNALVFNGTICMVASSLIFFLRGRQRRRERDEQMLQDSLAHAPAHDNHEGTTANDLAPKDPPTSSGTV
ncbi:major facilitator superfamily domain-containing protein [Flagelloscypha sp. PMI_526]|nr:major facilitator superfamily domain-containing protein [Flagelloscypha sp. PMI_526]